MGKYFIIYLLVINIVVFLLMGIDKLSAIKKNQRISEITLLSAILFGGSIGGLNGMVFFRHKISKKKFHLIVPCIFILHGILYYLFLYKKAT